MNYKKAIAELEKELFNDIMQKDESELNEELSELTGDVDLKLKSYRSIVEQATINLKKQKLLDAKEKLKNYKKETATRPNLIESLLSKGIDLKQYLIELYAQGKIPTGLTVAFRDGKDISDEEAASIIANLSELGEIDLDG